MACSTKQTHVLVPLIALLVLCHACSSGSAGRQPRADHGGPAFAPVPVPMQASGTVVWKRADGTMQTYHLQSSGTCMVPGSSGLGGIKPCFDVGGGKMVILLDADAGSLPSDYKGRVMEIQH